MKFFTLPPTSNLELMDMGTAGHFCLAHLYVSDENYRNHFLEVRKRPNSFILLDNGAAEHSLVDDEVLLSIVEDLKPNEVIAPDVLNNFSQTLLNLENFVYKMQERKFLEHTKIFFCPQGDNMIEWLKSYLLALSNRHVSTIGLSKIALPHCMYGVKDDVLIAESRRRTLIGLDNLDLIKKPLHLLGAETPLEFNSHPVYSKVRSTDSCISVWSAINNKDWERGTVEDYERIPTPHDYFSRSMKESEIDLAKSNIKFLDQVVSSI